MMSENLTPLTDAEWEEKCALEALPCQGIALDANQTARHESLSKRARLPKIIPPGQIHDAIKIPKMTEMIAGDPGVGGGPVA